MRQTIMGLLLKHGVKISGEGDPNDKGRGSRSERVRGLLGRQGNDREVHEEVYQKKRSHSGWGISPRRSSKRSSAGNGKPWFHCPRDGRKCQLLGSTAILPASFYALVTTPPSEALILEEVIMR